MPKRAQDPRILDLFVEDSWPNVYAGELEMRPSAAPTTNPSAGREPPRIQHPQGEAAVRNRKGVVDRLWISGSQSSAGQGCRAVLTFSVRAIDARHAEPGVWETPDS
jgi:hypothetical protein